MSTRIVHRLTVELGTLRCGTFTALRYRPTIPLAIVELVIHVPVKARRPVIPRPRANEHAARKPLRPIIPVGSAVVRRRLIVSVRTNWWPTTRHGYGNARWAAPGHQHPETNRHNTQPNQNLHSFLSVVR